MHHLLCPHCWFAVMLFLAALIPFLKTYVPGWKDKLKKDHTDDCGECCEDKHTCEHEEVNYEGSNPGRNH